MKVAIVPIPTIKVGKRFREEMGDVEGLARSIESKGLITPLAVSLNPDSEGPELYSLLAGGRRFEAAKLAGLEEVPVRIYDRELSELELRSIELEENIQRKDLEWIEQVNLKKEIHELYTAIHGEKVSTLPDAPGWSMRDTADLLDKSIGGISMDIKLAEAVEKLPELEWDDCKTKSDAVKLMKRAEEAMIRAELSRRAEEASTSTGREAAKRRLMDSYVVRNYLEAAKDLEPKMFNLVEIDPPYAIELGKAKKVDGISKYEYGPKGYNEISSENYIPFIRDVLQATYPLMADNSWLIFWFAPEPWFNHIYLLLRDTGFEVPRLPGIWVKPSAQSKRPEIRLANSYEMFFWARKGNPPLAKPGASNVFIYPQVPSQKKIHPTERPLELMLDIVSTFAFENSCGLVPFAGSGVTLQAMHQLKMHPVGFDLGQQHKDAFNVRVMRDFVA